MQERSAKLPVSQLYSIAFGDKYNCQRQYSKAAGLQAPHSDKLQAHIAPHSDNSV